MSGDSGVDTKQAVPVNRLIAAGLILVLAVWFVLANTGDVSVRLWVAKVTMPMWIMLVAVFAGGWLVGWLVRLRRNRRSRKE